MTGEWPVTGEWEVHRVGAEEWPVLRRVRLRSLADAPEAFTSTVERETAFREADWRRRLDGSATFFASAGGDVVGLVTVMPPGGCTAEVVGMWVEPAARGTGVADGLLAAAVRWARERAAAAVELTVADGNDRARAFYRRAGFRPGAGSGDAGVAGTRMVLDLVGEPQPEAATGDRSTQATRSSAV